MKYSKGDRVYWIDPDDNHSTGLYNILKVIPNDDETVYLIGDGYSESEVAEHELVSAPDEFLPEMDILRKETK